MGIVYLKVSAEFFASHIYDSQLVEVISYNNILVFVLEGRSGNPTHMGKNDF